MKREDLLLVTPEKFKKFGPCWLKTREGRARFRNVAKMRARWNALDILDLEDVRDYEKLWSVLREAFLPPMLLHEFACRCAEWALSLVENPDKRSVEAIRVKRLWMTGEVTYCELMDARVAARAAVWATEWAAGRKAARAAAWSAERAAAAAAWSAAKDARWAASFAVPDGEGWEHEVEILCNLINEWEE